MKKTVKTLIIFFPFSIKSLPFFKKSSELHEPHMGCRRALIHIIFRQMRHKIVLVLDFVFITVRQFLRQIPRAA